MLDGPDFYGLIFWEEELFNTMIGGNLIIKNKNQTNQGNLFQTPQFTLILFTCS